MAWPESSDVTSPHLHFSVSPCPTLPCSELALQGRSTGGYSFPRLHILRAFGFLTLDFFLFFLSFALLLGWSDESPNRYQIRLQSRKEQSKRIGMFIKNRVWVISLQDGMLGLSFYTVHKYCKIFTCISLLDSFFFILIIF